MWAIIHFEQSVCYDLPKILHFICNKPNNANGLLAGEKNARIWILLFHHSCITYLHPLMIMTFIISKQTKRMEITNGFFFFFFKLIQDFCFAFHSNFYGLILINKNMNTLKSISHWTIKCKLLNEWNRYAIKSCCQSVILSEKKENWL